MKPRDLQEGDVCRYDDGRIAYRVQEILSVTPNVTARIKWEQDGGIDVRTWTNASEDIPSLGRPTRAQS